MPTPYEILDVFTDTPLAGNPLAIVYPDAPLDAAAMQAIAGEFNLSETVFLTASPDGHTATGRIFTPKAELAFAGHPTVGAAVALSGRHGRAEVTIALPLGLVRAAVSGGRAAFDAPELPTLFGEGLDAAPIAEALGLPVEAIGFGRMTPAHASVGPGFTVVPVDSAGRLAAIRLDLSAWERAFAAGFRSVHVVAPDGPDRFRARMFAPEAGIAEDPATGSAAVAFAAPLVAAERLADGIHALTIRQGVEMGRPSEIGLEVEVAGGLLGRVSLSGAAVRIAEGTLFV